MVVKMNQENHITEYSQKIQNKNEKYIENTYHLIKDYFGKTVTYKGRDWIIVGLSMDHETMFEGNFFSIKSQLMIELKCSFNESKEISLEDYIKWKNNRMF